MDKDAIVGHERQIADLETDLRTGNVSHAYLFAGPAHIGKSTVARWFGKQLLTQNMALAEKEETERQIERLIHPDFLCLDRLWIEDRCEDLDLIAQSSNLPQGHRWKAPAMRSDVISIDDVRVIQHRLQETGAGGRRVCFIRGIERLQDAAANAFLKILEEPPEGRVFLLTTERASSLLPTLLSRARVLTFRGVPNPSMAPLIENLSEEDQSFVLHIAQGAPGMAKRLATDVDQLREKRLMHSQAVAFWGPMSVSERLKLLTPLTEKGNADQFLLHLALALRENPTVSVERAMAFRRLTARMQTNAYKPLILQEFVLSLT